ncbi:MAG: large-conductance mechanosensitive channel protein MscL [Anaerolineales bacterium]
MWKDFKEFAMKGNVVDLAVGIIIGAAFNSIVNSLVEDIIMPPIGLLLQGVDFTNLFIDLSGEGYGTLAAAREAGAATINYGIFINNVLNFLIIALVVYLLVTWVNRVRRGEEEAPAEPTTKECPVCFTVIPIKAHRCPNCTSELVEAPAA